MHPSRMSSRYSIFNFRHLCEITGLNPDGSLRASSLPAVSAGPLNQQPAVEGNLADFNFRASDGPDEP